MKKLFLFVAVVSFINATAGFTHGMYPHDDVVDTEVENRKDPSFQNQDMVDDELYEEDEDMDDNMDDDMDDGMDDYDQQMDEEDDDMHQYSDKKGVEMKDQDGDSDEYGQKDMSDTSMKKKKKNKLKEEEKNQKLNAMLEETEGKKKPLRY